MIKSTYAKRWEKKKKKIIKKGSRCEFWSYTDYEFKFHLDQNNFKCSDTIHLATDIKKEEKKTPLIDFFLTKTFSYDLEVM